MTLEEEAKKSITVIESMLKWRRGQLDNPDKNDWAKTRMSEEINALESLLEHAKVGLTSKGINI
jgi:hypothetical protein